MVRGRLGAPMDRPLRVAVTLEQCWHRVPGGTARAALDHVRAVAAHSDVEQIGVAARHGGPPAPEWFPSIEVRHLGLPRPVLYESWHRLRRPAIERATGAVDVIHATGMAVPPHSAPLVVTVHDLAFIDEPGHSTSRGLRFFHRSIELARAQADVVVCPSQATVDDCVRHGFDARRLMLVPWGTDVHTVDASRIAGARARFGIAGRYMLWAGTIEPRKNLPVLLDAFARVAETDRDITLVLAGPTGWNESIGDRVAALGARVRSLGFVDRSSLDALMAGAELFCFPSRREGFGLPVLEAMAAGTAVITSSGTSTAEVVGESGVVVHPDDVDGLAAEISRLLVDDGERERLAAAGRDRAERVFTWEATASALVSAYERAASS